MQIGEFDSIVMKDGRAGSVCEVLEPGVAYLVDFPKPMDGEFASQHGLVTFDTELVKQDEIERVATDGDD